jgi:predicted polyphosphate/ATP-dependent NAD kinase
MQDEQKRLGLIVNPVAGIGGRVGLKGSDGAEIQRQALKLGAVPQALNRATQALEKIGDIDGLEIITYPGEMGEDAAKACGVEPKVIGSIKPGETTAEDTRKAARDMLRQGVDLLLFAGGDGTARAALYLKDRLGDLHEAEVMDLDEEAFRQGVVSAKLYGYLKIPFRTSLVQNLKMPSAGEGASLASIAYDVVEKMEDDWLYIIGPGTTTRAITDELGLGKTLIGVDVVLNRELVAPDVNEAQLLDLLKGRRAKIVVTLIGGQGCVFGRGNQQISPQIIDKVGRENIIVVSSPEKLYALGQQPLWVDTGDEDVDRMLTGYIKVVTGYDQRAVRKVS